jgi:hypothetical protein
MKHENSLLSQLDGEGNESHDSCTKISSFSRPSLPPPPLSSLRPRPPPPTCSSPASSMSSGGWAPTLASSQSLRSSGPRQCPSLLGAGPIRARGRPGPRWKGIGRERGREGGQMH